VPPGGAPPPPECVPCVGTPAGAAPVEGPELPGARRRIEDLFSGPASGLLHHQDASRVAPLCEQGARRIREVLEAGITFFWEVIPDGCGVGRAKAQRAVPAGFGAMSQY
jgi:hypothetical protein